MSLMFCLTFSIQYSNNLITEYKITEESFWIYLCSHLLFFNINFHFLRMTTHCTYKKVKNGKRENVYLQN